MANRLYNKQISPKGYKDGGMTKGVKEDPRRDQMKQPLKKPTPAQKGLKKLPTKVRNKMGYMKKGGVVSDTKKKQFKENKAGQKSFNKKAMKVATTIGKIIYPSYAAGDVASTVKKKIKGAK